MSNNLNYPGPFYWNGLNIFPITKKEIEPIYVNIGKYELKCIVCESNQNNNFVCINCIKKSFK